MMAALIDVNNPPTADLLGLTHPPTAPLIDFTEPPTCGLIDLSYSPNPSIYLAEPPPQYPCYYGKPVGNKFVAVDGFSLKKSLSRLSLRDYLCEACGKMFTQCHTLHEHRRFHCPNLETEELPKTPCSNCDKMLSKSSWCNHLQNGCSLPPKEGGQECPNRGKKRNAKDGL